LHSINIHYNPLEITEAQFSGFDGHIAESDSVQSSKLDIWQVDLADATTQIDVQQTIAEKDSPALPFVLNRKKRTLFGSLLLHTTFLTILIYFSAQQTPLILQPVPEVDPIQAILYYPPRPEPLPIEPEVVENEAAEPEVVETESAEPEAITKPVDATQEIEISNETPELVREEIISPEPNSDTPPALDAPQSPETPVASVDNTSTSNLQRLNQALSSHLGQIADQEMQAMSNDAVRNRARDFYQQQTQGYSLVEEDPNERPTKNIDCSGTGGKAVGMLSGLLGGTLRCTDKPDFQKYIDARLNKEKQD